MEEATQPISDTSFCLNYHLKSASLCVICAEASWLDIQDYVSN